MKILIQIILPTILFCYSCNIETKKESIEQLKHEILETEQNFASLVKDKGVATAFLAYADEEAVLMRNNSIIVGRDAIRTYYKNQSSKDKHVQLTWKPDFVDVAESGDIGYTYGHYTFTFVDSTNNKIEIKGVFHTVWKRQPDGSWRFVWD